MVLPHEVKKEKNIAMLVISIRNVTPDASLITIRDE
jgi:hypothetical protein